MTSVKLTMRLRIWNLFNQGCLPLQNWNLVVIDIKDYFFQIPLDPAADPRFAFSIPTINQEAPRKRYYWRVLPQGMTNSFTICHRYVCAEAGEAIILCYMDDVLLCAPDDNVLDLTINSLVASGFELKKEKIQWMPPWRYLALEMVRRPLFLKNLPLRTIQGP